MRLCVAVILSEAKDLFIFLFRSICYCGNAALFQPIPRKASDRFPNAPIVKNINAINSPARLTRREAEYYNISCGF